MLKKLIRFLVPATILLLPGCHNDRKDTRHPVQDEPGYTNPFSLKPDLLPAGQTIQVSAGDLSLVFADNSAYDPDHREGYNGISELRHSDQDSNVFVPFYAGFNLEHIFAGDSLVQLFEPRLHAMELFRINDNEVLLYQSPTPLSNVESLTHFEIVEPNYIDAHIRLIIHQSNFFSHGYAGLFWASYINRPADKKIYFRGYKKDHKGENWIEAYSSEHGMKSTHRWAGDTTEIFFSSDFNATLASHFSDYVYTKPFFYGRFHQMVLAYFFDRTEGIRFSQSPTGGGETNPAWDFQYIIPDFGIEKEYTLNVRLVYKKWEGRENILEEYAQWDSENNPRP